MMYERMTNDYPAGDRLEMCPMYCCRARAYQRGRRNRQYRRADPGIFMAMGNAAPTRRSYGTPGRRPPPRARDSVPVLENELIALLENTADAACSVARDGTIRSWNRAAELLFGYEAQAVRGRNVDEVLQAHDALGTEALAGGSDAAARKWNPEAAGIPDFDLRVRTSSGAQLWINVSTIMFHNARTRHRLFIRLVRDVTERRAREKVVDRMREIAREMLSLTTEITDHSPVEGLSDQERRILRLFADGRTAIGIARELKISPPTAPIT